MLRAEHRWTDDPTAMPRARHRWAKGQAAFPIATSRLRNRAMGYIARWSLTQSRAVRSWQPTLTAQHPIAKSSRICAEQQIIAAAISMALCYASGAFLWCCSPCIRWMECMHRCDRVTHPLQEPAPNHKGRTQQGGAEGQPIQTSAYALLTVKSHNGHLVAT